MLSKGRSLSLSKGRSPMLSKGRSLSLSKGRSPSLSKGYPDSIPPFFDSPGRSPIRPSINARFFARLHP